MDTSAAVYEAVCAAVTQDPSRVQAATEALITLEKEAGTFNVLYSIAAQRNLPLDVRKLAIIRMKNVGVSAWRRRSAFTPDHKVAVRNGSMTFLDEPDDTIARYNSIIISKIARIDFPGAWPNLIDGLLGVLQTNLEQYFSAPSPPPQAALVLRRALDILNQVIKELIARRTPDGQKIMAQARVTTALTAPLAVSYGQFTTRIKDSLNINTLQLPEMAEAITIMHLTFKCLSKLMVWLWSKINNKDFAAGESMVLEFFKTTSTMIQPFYEVRTSIAIAMLESGVQNPAARTTLDIFTRHVRHYGQLFRKMAVGNITRFVAIPGSTDLVLFYWSIVLQAANADPKLRSEANDAIHPLQFICQALALMKDTLPQWSPTKKGIAPESVLSADFVQNAVQLLLTRFLPLTPADLEKWSLDSEEWTNEEEAEAGTWEYDLRPCAERVLVVLSSRFPDFVLPLIKDKFFAITQNALSRDLNVILQEEALYCALGNTIHHLHNAVDFDSWTRTTVIQQVRSTNPDHRILKRRVAWLIGKWVSQCQPRITTSHVWQVLSHLLSDKGESSDIAVRLTASSALRDSVDALGFELDIFKPFLAIFITELLQLIGEAETAVAKRRVASTLSSIVPLIPTIIAPLPQLWGGTHEDSTFRATILGLVQAVVTAAGEQHSASLAHVVVPLVQESMNPPLSTALDGDGLALWLAALRHTNTIEPPQGGSTGLVELFPLAVRLLATNLDLLGSLTAVVKSYVLLDGQRIFQARLPVLADAFANASKVFGTDLCTAVRTMLQNATQVNGKEAIVMLNIAVQSCEPSVWAQAFHQSGLFAHLLLSLMDEKASSPRAIATKVPTTTLVEHVLLFTRMMVCDAQVFVQLMNATAGPEFNHQETRLYEGLLDQIWNKFDAMVQPQPRKLLALGLAAFTATGRPEVLGRLVTEIFNVWLDVFGEMKEAIDPENVDNPLTTYWRKSERAVPIDADVEGTPEETRVQQLAARDPIQTQKLTLYAAEKLAQAEAVVGGRAALEAQYLSKGDTVTIQAIQTALQEGLGKY
ncbi:ran binding protein 11 [Auricularia subglabra TFB-10046 SS5]|nr:ran binding protein 11 [Auricularia subglabra TFB-10046 SS5]